MRTEELREAAERAIEGAFPIEPLPDPDQVRNDHCPECRELADRFSARPWPEIDAFYKEERWPGWQRDVGRLPGDRAFSVYPFLFAAGEPISKRSRRPV